MEAPNPIKEQRLADALLATRPEAPVDKEQPKTETKVKAKKEVRPLFGPRQHKQALILEPNAEVDVHDITKAKDARIVTASGAYDILPGKMYHLPVAVGPGNVLLYFSGNPEPVTDLPPTGFGSKMWGNMNGGKLFSLAIGAFQPPSTPFGMKTWVKWVVIGLAVAAVAGVIIYEVMHQGTPTTRVGH